MAEETNPNPVESAEQTPTVVEGQPEPQDTLVGGQGAPVDSTQEGDAAEPSRAPDAWKDREIARLRARVRELRGTQPSPVATPTSNTPPAPIQPPNNLDELVESRANALAAQRAFDQRCSEAAEAGKKTFGEETFNRSVQGLMNLVDRNDPQQVNMYNSFLLAALETGEAARLVHTLGSDLDEAARIMALSPTRMAVELTRLAAKEPPAEPSRAPRPIQPVGSQARMNASPINPDDADRADQLSTAEWMRRRAVQVDEIRKSGRPMR